MSATLINQGTGTAASGTTLSVTIPAPVSGNILLVAVAIASKTAARTISTVSLTGTSGWTHLGDNANGLLVESLWMGNVGASAGTAMTITLSGTNNGSCGSVSEWSGITEILGQVDLSAGSGLTGSSTSPSTTTVTLLTNHDLVCVFETDANGTSPTVQPSPGYTPLTFVGLSGFCGMQVNYGTFNIADNPFGAWTISPSANWVTDVWAFTQTAAITTNFPDKWLGSYPDLVFDRVSVIPSGEI